MVRAGLSEWYLAFSVNELLLTQHAAWGSVVFESCISPFEQL